LYVSRKVSKNAKIRSAKICTLKVNGSREFFVLTVSRSLRSDKKLGEKIAPLLCMTTRLITPEIRANKYSNQDLTNIFKTNPNPESNRKKNEKTMKEKQEACRA